MNKKLDIFSMFNLRKDLPNCFSPDERKTYRKNLSKLKEIVSNLTPFEPGTQVRCTTNRCKFENEDDEGDENFFPKHSKKFKEVFDAIDRLKKTLGYYDKGRTATIIGSYYELFGRANEFDGSLRDGFGRKFSPSEDYVLNGYLGHFVESLTKYDIRFNDNGQTSAWWHQENLEPLKNRHSKTPKGDKVIKK